jgi:Cu/Ag efflux protein CusF
MITRLSSAVTAGLSAAALIAGCGTPAPPAPHDEGANNTAPVVSDLPSRPDSIRFAMPGEATAMPSLAASGSRIAIVWTGTKNGAMNVYAAVSEDGGVTFPVQTRVNDRDQDVSANVEQPPRVAVTATEIAVVWASKRTGAAAIRLARSKDGGRTFGRAITLHDPSLKGARGWQSLAAGPDGLLHAVWLDGRNAMDHSSMPNAGSPRQDVYAAVIDPDNKVTETQVAANVCFCCKTAVVAGNANRVLAAWRHIFPGSIRDIAMAVSADGGREFGPLARVSEDKWTIAACPEDGPALALDARETVHAVWPAVVSEGQPQGQSQKVVFYASTADGRTFTPRVRLSASGQDEAAHPQIAGGRSGGLAAVWDEPHDGLRLVMFRPIWPGGQSGIGRSLNTSITGSHPVIAPVADGFLVAWTSAEGAASAIVMRHVAAEEPPGKPGEKRPFAFRGKVEQVDARAGTVTVQGDDVPGWMGAMTMVYKVENKDIVARVKPGDRIAATVYTDDFQTLHGVAIVAADR